MVPNAERCCRASAAQRRARSLYVVGFVFERMGRDVMRRRVLVCARTCGARVEGTMSSGLASAGEVGRPTPLLPLAHAPRATILKHIAFSLSTTASIAPRPLAHAHSLASSKAHDSTRHQRAHRPVAAAIAVAPPPPPHFVPRTRAPRRPAVPTGAHRARLRVVGSQPLPLYIARARVGEDAQKRRLSLRPLVVVVAFSSRGTPPALPIAVRAPTRGDTHVEAVVTDHPHPPAASMARAAARRSRD